MPLPWGLRHIAAVGVALAIAAAAHAAAAHAALAAAKRVRPQIRSKL